MIRYQCDRCGASLGANDSDRFILRLELYAAAGPVELNLESGKDTRRELSELIESLSKADPDDVEDRTYRCLRFDLCNCCRQAILERPFG